MSHRSDPAIAALAGALVVIVTACAPAQHTASSLPSPTGVQAAASAERQGLIIDTDASIWPDPADRTGVRMAEVRRFLADYKHRHGQLPATLAEALPSPRSGWIMDYARDGWGSALRYAAMGAEYELRSAGADRQFGTADDVVVTGMLGTRWG